jgi:hypothetical protein
MIKLLVTMQRGELPRNQIKVEVEADTCFPRSIPLVVIDGIYLHPIATTLYHPRLSSAVSGANRPHDANLNKGARSNSRYRILIIMRKMKVPAKPHFDLRILLDNPYEILAILRAMI